MELGTPNHQVNIYLFVEKLTCLTIQAALVLLTSWNTEFQPQTSQELRETQQIHVFAACWTHTFNPSHLSR